MHVQRMGFFVISLMLFFPASGLAQFYGWGWGPVQQWQYDMSCAINSYRYGYYTGGYGCYPVTTPRERGAIIGGVLGGLVGYAATSNRYHDRGVTGGAAIGGLAGLIIGGRAEPRPVAVMIPGREWAQPVYTDADTDVISNPTRYVAEIYGRRGYLGSIAPGGELLTRSGNGPYRAMVRIRQRGGHTTNMRADLDPTDRGWAVVY